MNIQFDSDMANTVMARIETSFGTWTDYGNDGRTTVESSPLIRSCDLPRSGWRARFRDENPPGGDYGWGPLANREQLAIIGLLAEYAWT